MRWLFLLVIPILSIACGPKAPKADNDGHELSRIFCDSLILNTPKTKNELIRESSWAFLRSGRIDSAIILSVQLIRQTELDQVPPEVHVDAHTHMGQISMHIKSHTNYRRHIQKALWLYKDYNFETSWYERNLYSLLAGTYYILQDDLSLALKYYRKARQIAIQLKDPLHESSMLNNLGLTYLKLEKYDSAEVYFLHAKTILNDEKMEFESLNFSIVNNLAQVQYQRGLYQKTVDYFKNNYQRALQQIAEDSTLKTRLVTSNIGQAKANIALDKWKIASSQLSYARSHLAPIAPHEKLGLQLEIFQLEQLIYNALGDFESALKMTDSIASVVRTIHQNEMVANDFATEKMLDLHLESASFALQQQQHKERALRQKTNFNWLLTISSLTLIIVAAIFLIILARKRNTALKVEQQLMHVNLRNMELEEDALRILVEDQGEDLRTLAGHTALLRELADEVKLRLSSLGKEDVKTQKGQLKKLNASLTLRLNDDRVHEILRENLDKVNAGFYSRLEMVSQEKLSRVDKELCALFRLNLSSQQIAELRNTGAGAIRVARHRIKKKLNLDKKGDDLQAFLEQL